jgi:hypothetical protein
VRRALRDFGSSRGFPLYSILPPLLSPPMPLLPAGILRYPRGASSGSTFRHTQIVLLWGIPIAVPIDSHRVSGVVNCGKRRIGDRQGRANHQGKVVRRGGMCPEAARPQGPEAPSTRGGVDRVGLSGMQGERSKTLEDQRMPCGHRIARYCRQRIRGRMAGRKCRCAALPALQALHGAMESLEAGIAGHCGHCKHCRHWSCAFGRAERREENSLPSLLAVARTKAPG